MKCNGRRDGNVFEGGREKSVMKYKIERIRNFQEWMWRVWIRAFSLLLETSARFERV